MQPCCHLKTDTSRELARDSVSMLLPALAICRPPCCQVLIEVTRYTNACCVFLAGMCYGFHD